MRGGTRPAPDRFVAAGASQVGSPLCWFRLESADRPTVAPGDVIKAGDPLFEHVDDDQATASRSATAGDQAVAVVSGVVDSVDGRGISVRAEGDGLPGVFCWGRSVRGPLIVAVATPEDGLRASAIDVAAAGSIVVAGARVDIETITRARALGVRGIISGGLLGKDLRQLEASQARQRLSIQPLAPFAVLVLDGYGPRPIAGPAWDALRAVAGREVSIVTDPPHLLLGRGAVRRTSPGPVRVTAGRDLGREGRLVELRGQVRASGGVYLPAGLVSLESRNASEPVERRIIALADLERLD